MILSNQCQRCMDNMARAVEDNKTPFYDAPRREANRLMAFMPVISDAPQYVKNINKSAISDIYSGSAVPYFAVKYNALPKEPTSLQMNYHARKKEEMAKKAPVLYRDNKETSLRTQQLYEQQKQGKISLEEYKKLIDKKHEISFIQRCAKAVRKFARTALSKAALL